MAFQTLAVTKEKRSPKQKFSLDLFSYNCVSFLFVEIISFEIYFQKLRIFNEKRSLIGYQLAHAEFEL